MAYSKLMHGCQSVTPKPLQGVTPVTVGVKTIRTPKHTIGLGVPGPMVSVQDIPSTNHEPDAQSQRSVSQKSAFKPYQRNKDDHTGSRSGSQGVTKTNKVTERQREAEEMLVAPDLNVPSANSGNCLTPEGKLAI